MKKKLEKITITGSVRDGDPDNNRNTCHGSGKKKRLRRQLQIVKPVVSGQRF